MGPLTKKIEIYDNVDYNIAVKLGAPSETGWADKCFWNNDYEIDVISSETKEKLYTVYMDLDGTWLQAKIFSMAWNEKGHFDFELFDDYFQEIKKTIVRLRTAVNRIRNPYELSKAAESEYLDYIRKKAKDVIKYSIDCNYHDMYEFCLEQGLLKKNNIEELISYAEATDKVWWQKKLSDWKTANKTAKKKTSEKWIKDPIHEEWVFGKNLDGTYTIEKYRGNETEIVIPSEYKGHRITSIAFSVFSGDKAPKFRKVTSITIPKGIKTIEQECFYNCDNLKTLKWPDTITAVGFMALSGCNQLELNYYEHGYYLGNDENPYACFIHVEREFCGVLTIHEDTTTLLHGGAAHGKIEGAIIPAGITTLSHGFFNGCMDLSYVEIPESIEFIMSDCFSTCIQLTDVKLPEGLKGIGECSFVACRSLDEIVIPEGITEIKDTTFWNCNKLKKIKLPNTVTKIGHNAFSGCTSLTEINVPDDLQEVSSIAFENCPEKTKSLFKGMEDV